MLFGTNAWNLDQWVDERRKPQAQYDRSRKGSISSQNRSCENDRSGKNVDLGGSAGSSGSAELAESAGAADSAGCHAFTLGHAFAVISDMRCTC